MGLVQDTATFIKNAWDAVEEMGGDVPPENKNLANLTAGIASIPQGPAVPKSLEQLKKMVNTGREIVVGTEIPDDYAGQSNPLIVAQNLNSTNNSSYGGAEGVILVRKYVVANRTVAFNTDNSSNYENSTVQQYLNTTYLNNCSDELKKMLSEITIPYYNRSSLISLSGNKWFLMSAYEVCNNGYASNPKEGIIWDYWKQKTGLSSPDDMFTANPGRVVLTPAGAAGEAWLRSNHTAPIDRIYRDGQIDANNANSLSGVLPACFIGKD